MMKVRGKDKWNYFKPAAPSNVNGSAGNAEVALTWTASSSISQMPIIDYIVQYSSNNGYSWTTVRDGVTNGTAAIVTGLSNGTEYKFRIAAVNGVGQGPFSLVSSGLTPVAGDSLWANVKLLISGDSSIADISSYNRSVMISGASVSTQQKRWGTASVLFDGVDDYLQLSDNDDVELLNGDFVIEMWIRTTSSTRYATLISRTPNSFSSGMWSLMLNAASSTSGDIAMYVNDVSSSVPTLLSTGVNVRDGEWHHVAVSRSGSLWSMYVDGSRVATASSSATIANISGGIRIGDDQYYGRNYAGNIDDLRITLGSSRNYTGSTIGVPTTAFTAIGTSGAATDGYYSSVALLLHADGSGSTFVDSSPAPKSITVNGNTTQSTAQSKWNGKSAYFDGSGDWLSVPSVLLLNDFTVETWIRFVSRGTYNVICAGSNTNSQLFISLDSSGNNVRCGLTGVAEIATGAISWNNNQWYHLAVVRNSGSWSIFVDGVNVTNGSPSNSTSFSGAFRICADENGGSNGNYFLDDFRVSTIARYTANFTPPVTAFPDRGNYTDPFMDKVSLLLHSDGSGSAFVDSSLVPKNVSVANATQSSVQSQFGGKSAYFDGSTYSYLDVGNGSSLAFDSTTPFVVEGWIYPTRTFNNQQSGFRNIFSRRTPYSYSANYAFFLNYNSNQIVFWNGGGVLFKSVAQVSLDSWTYFAWSYNGNGTLRIYLNGILDSTFSAGPGVSVSDSAKIGSLIDDTGSQNNFGGFIDDLRITKGSDRGYDGNTIVVPTTAFPDS